jgi:hypothetical protein
MAKYKMIALSNPVAGEEARFNDWYDRHHLADICAVHGVVRGQRFKLVSGTKLWTYAAIYDLEVDDPRALIGEIYRRLGTNTMLATDALDQATVHLSIFEPMGQGVDREVSVFHDG